MKITSFKLIPVEIPMTEPFAIAGGLSKAARNVVLIIDTDEGLQGYGEAAPSSAFSTETLESVYWCLRRHLAPVLIGEDPLDISRIMEKVNENIHGNYFAKAAIDLALHDVSSKSLKVPLYALLGGRQREAIAAGVGLVGIADVDETVKRAVKWSENGFKIVKLKIGVNPAKDIERISKVRDALGNDVQIRIDANQAYNVDSAMRIIRKISKWETISHFEQPVSASNIEGMAEIARKSEIPIVADESLETLEDAFRVLRKKAANILNLKIMRVGGIYQAKKIAFMAEAAGVPCFEGSMNELGIGLAAKLHFAISTGGIQMDSEIGPTNMRWKDDIVTSNPRYTEGRFFLSQAEGLGVELDMGKLARYQVQWEQ
jgi:o-succinylbenzoate synthase